MRWFKILLITLLSLLLLFVVGYVVIQLGVFPDGSFTKLKELPYKTFFKWFGIILGIVVVASGVIYGAYKLFNRKGNGRSENDDLKR